MNPRLATLWVLCCALVPTHAIAADDFEPGSRDWNGLGALIETAGLAKVELSVTDRLDWSTVQTEDVLFLLAPRTAPQGEALDSLLRFVEAGGRLTVADDFGAGDAWLRPFGLELLDRAGNHAARYQDLAHLPQVTVNPEPAAVLAARRWLAPRARLSLAGFLGHDVASAVTLNHPAALRVTSPLPADRVAVLWGRYDEPGLGWLAEADRGAGRVLALADPSLFITTMLEKFHDNKQFAANVLRYSCVSSRPCKVRLIVRANDVTGRFEGKPLAREADLRSGLTVLQQALDWLAAALRGPWVAPALLATVLWLLAWPPWRLARSPQPPLPPRPELQRPDSVRLANIGAWLSHERADYRRPARLLATHLARQLESVERPEPAGGRVERLATGRFSRAGGPGFDTGFSLSVRAQAIDSLVRRGRCSAQAADRLRQVFRQLETLSRDEAEPLNRTDFTRLAAEVEWAESLIVATRDPSDVPAQEPA